MSSQPRIPVGGAILLAVAGLCLSGCHRTSNPWRDQSPTAAELETPSVRGFRALTATPSTGHRPYAQTVAAPVDGSVLHGPLYWEDPFEDKGSEDGCIAWTGEDYLHIAYGPARYLLNGLFFPASIVVTPPWADLVSDGCLSRQMLGCDHDAARVCCHCRCRSH